MIKKKKYRKERKGGYSKPKLFDLIINVFRENPSKQLNYKQVSRILNIKEMGVKILLIDIMNELVNNSILKEIKRGSYVLIEQENKTFVTIKNTNKNGAFVNLNDNEELFIDKKYSQFVLVGDKVEIKILNYNGKKSGKVVNVIKRKKNEFVGIIDNSSSNYFLITDDKRVNFDVFLNSKTIKKKFLNKKVLVKVEGWDTNYKNPTGNVIKVIGEIDDHNAEINSILFDYGFNPLFSKKVIDETNKIDKVISEQEIKKRLDIRKINTFTIDPEDAKDFDDALSVRELNKDVWEIGVHIADVSHYVKKGSALDKEAISRGNSVYLVDRVIPMLPEIISNDICSLKPNKDRLTYSVFFNLDKKANIIDYKIKKTVIHSDFRFTYDTAQYSIENKIGKFYNELILLDNFSKILRKKRQKEGSINFEGSEVKFILDKDNNPIDVYFKEIVSTNHLIEEFMLLANKTVAEYIGYTKKTANPFIYRVHDKPDKDKISSLYNIVKKLGYSIDNKNPKNLSNSLNILLKNVKGKPEQKLIETLTVRTMQKAIYSTKNIGHYGLGFNYYSHFTSPIRRYPDLIVHRLLENNNINKLENICKHCSEMEKTATQAERDSIKYMQIKYLQNKIGKIYEGVISGVTEWGLYIEIIKNKCEGLVRVNSMKDDHYIFDEKKYSLVGYKNKISYTLGQNVRIKIKNTNLNRKQIDFCLV